MISLDTFIWTRFNSLALFGFSRLSIDNPVEICKIAVILSDSMLPDL